MDKRNIIIAVLIVALAIVSYIAFKPEPAPFDTEHYEQRINALTEQKNRLIKELNAEIGKQNSFHDSIVFLKNQKPKVEIVYIEKTKQINNSSVNELVSEFSEIFSKNGVSK